MYALTKPDAPKRSLLTISRTRPSPLLSTLPAATMPAARVMPAPRSASAACVGSVARVDSAACSGGGAIGVGVDSVGSAIVSLEVMTIQVCPIVPDNPIAPKFTETLAFMAV